VGSIFLECGNDPGFSDFNTVLYGHNMNNGSMFGSLRKYKKKSWWKAHPTVYITDQNGSRAYQIFAAYEVSTAGDTYQIGFPAGGARQSFLDFCTGSSVYDTGVVPSVYDHIVTLSTCTGRGHATRWVVQAAAAGTPPAESAPAESAPAEPASGTSAADAPTENAAAAGAPAADTSAEDAAAGSLPDSGTAAPAESAETAGEAVG
jgi:sortase B